MELICSGFELTEAPLADPSAGRILFSDAIGGGLWALGPDGSVASVVAHRRAIGGATLHAAGGVIVSGHNVAWKTGERTVPLLANTLGRGHTHFNDLTTDAAGRVYVGLVDMPAVPRAERRQRSVLWRIDVDGSVTIVDDSTLAGANGMCISADGRTLFVADTFADTLWAFDVAADGSLHQPRAAIRWDEPAGPDGIALNADGTLWVALHFAGVVERVDPTGEVHERLAVPLPPTSICHAGTDLTDLHITTGGGGGRAGVFRTRTSTPGRLPPPAQVGRTPSAGPTIRR